MERRAIPTPLTLDVREDRSNINYSSAGQIESVAGQQLLPGLGTKYRKRRNCLKTKERKNSTRGHNHLPWRTVKYRGWSSTSHWPSVASHLPSALAPG